MEKRLSHIFTLQLTLESTWDSPVSFAVSRLQSTCQSSGKLDGSVKKKKKMYIYIKKTELSVCSKKWRRKGKMGSQTLFCLGTSKAGYSAVGAWLNSQSGQLDASISGAGGWARLCQTQEGAVNFFCNLIEGRRSPSVTVLCQEMTGIFCKHQHD